MYRRVSGLIVSMLTVFKHLFKKAVTLEYPEKKIIQPENFRGKPYVDGCVQCMTCTKVCPSGAIKIENNKFIIDLNKCIFCGNCAYYCPSKSIKMGHDYELASSDKTDLNLIYDLIEREGNNA